MAIAASSIHILKWMDAFVGWHKVEFSLQQLPLVVIIKADSDCL